MRGAAILAVAVVIGAALAAGLYAAFASAGVAAGAGLVAGYLVWGELSDRVNKPPPSAEPQPLLFDPVRRRRLIGVVAFLGATALVLSDFAFGNIETSEIREWGEDLGFWGPIILITVLAAAMVFAPLPEPPNHDCGRDSSGEPSWASSIP